MIPRRNRRRSGRRRTPPKSETESSEALRSPRRPHGTLHLRSRAAFVARRRRRGDDGGPPPGRGDRGARRRGGVRRRSASSRSSSRGSTRALCRFPVVSEGERGLLGVGYAPARVVPRWSTAEVGGTLDTTVQRARGRDARADGPGSPTGIGVRLPDRHTLRGRRNGRPRRARARISASSSESSADDEVDAVQYLTDAIVWRSAAERPPEGSSSMPPGCTGPPPRGSRGARRMQNAEEALATLFDGRPRADDRGRAEDRAPAAEGVRRGRDR